MNEAKRDKVEGKNSPLQTSEPSLSSKKLSPSNERQRPSFQPMSLKNLLVDSSGALSAAMLDEATEAKKPAPRTPDPTAPQTGNPPPRVTGAPSLIPSERSNEIDDTVLDPPRLPSLARLDDPTIRRPLPMRPMISKDDYEVIYCELDDRSPKRESATLPLTPSLADDKQDPPKQLSPHCGKNPFSLDFAFTLR